MKKMIFWLCALMLVPALAIAGGDGVSISELKAQTPNYLEGSYEAHGRHISFHAPIYTPDVEVFPILQVKRTQVSAKAEEKTKELLEKNTLYGQRIRDHSAGTLPENAFTYFTAYYQNLWAHETDCADLFAENQTDSLQDAIDFLKQTTSNLFSDQQIGCLPYRAGIKSRNYENLSIGSGAVNIGSEANGGELTEKGGYYIEAWQTLRGIPVIEGVERTFTTQGKRSVQNVLSNVSWIVLGEYLAPDYYTCVSTAMWTETGSIQPDTSLCEWKRIEQQIKGWIQSGRIREVYSIVLGYVAYAAPDPSYPNSDDAYQSEYWLSPTWCIECKYAANAEKELTHDVDANDLDAPSYHKEKGWRTLLIDARTGQIIDPEDESSNRYIYSDK